MTYNPQSRGIVPSSKSNKRQNLNDTGNTIIKGTPVRVSSLGIDTVDVSMEAHVDSFAGILSDDADDGDTAEIVSAGTIENLTTSFAVGASVYINKSGVLTDTKPAIGVASFVAGDFVVKVGTIAKNNSNPANKDLLVNIQIIGQL